MNLRVARVRGLPRDGLVEVALEAADVSGCARCAAGRGCGLMTGLMTGLGTNVGAAGGAPILLHARLAPGESVPVPGQRVTLELDPPDPRWLVPVALGYGLPTVALVAGVLLGGAAGGAAGLAGGLLAWRAFCSRPSVTLAPSCEARPCLGRSRIVRGDPSPLPAPE